MSVSGLRVEFQTHAGPILGVRDVSFDMGISFLFVSHDMSVVERISHQVAVMYVGRIVEIGPRAAVFEAPRHPYTRALLSAVPIPDPTCRTLRGEVEYLPLRSPIHPTGHVAPPSEYEEVAPGHLVLKEIAN